MLLRSVNLKIARLDPWTWFNVPPRSKRPLTAFDCQHGMPRKQHFCSQPPPHHNTSHISPCSYTVTPESPQKKKILKSFFPLILLLACIENTVPISNCHCSLLQNDLILAQRALDQHYLFPMTSRRGRAWRIYGDAYRARRITLPHTTNPVALCHR